MEQCFNVVNKGVFEVDSSRLELEADLRRKRMQLLGLLIHDCLQVSEELSLYCNQQTLSCVRIYN